MMSALKPPSAALKRLQTESNIWLATTRPGGRPHLVPVWFVWRRRRFYLCIESSSVKARNLLDQPRVSLALEDGSRPVICEGEATSVPVPWPVEVVRAFAKKYDWSIGPEDQYDELIRVRPIRWLGW